MHSKSTKNINRAIMCENQYMHSDNFRHIYVPYTFARSQGTSAFARSNVGITELPAEATAVKHFRDHQE